MKPIRVLVVDDSMLFRNMLSQLLEQDPMIHVVATAADPYQARDMIIRYDPDVMTLDVEMPRMNGIEFLRKLMPQHPIPTVMISSLNLQYLMQWLLVRLILLINHRIWAIIQYITGLEMNL